MHMDFVGVLVAMLLISHVVCPFLKFIPGFSQQHFTSFAGGVVAAYVLKQKIPELVESRDRIHVLLSTLTRMTPFNDLIVFMVALLGFELFYIVERFTASKKVTQTIEHQRRFVLNLSIYSLYNFIITYTLAEQVKLGMVYATLFTIAIALHFVISDNRFNRYFPKLFNVKSHLLLLAALFLGYLCSIIFPINIYAFALLTAFLSGAILYNAFSEEIALQRQTSMGLFFLGSVVMAGLLSFLLIK